MYGAVLVREHHGRHGVAIIVFSPFLRLISRVSIHCIDILPKHVVRRARPDAFAHRWGLGVKRASGFGVCRQHLTCPGAHNFRHPGGERSERSYRFVEPAGLSCHCILSLRTY